MIDYSKLAFGKGVSRKREKRDKKAIHRDTVAEVRAEVFRLDVVCAICLGKPHTTDEMNEVIARSKTRGLAPSMRFNRRNCVRLHRACHQQVTEHRIELGFVEPRLGVDGGLIVQRVGQPTAVVYRRGAKPKHEPLGVGVLRRGIWTPGATREGTQTMSESTTKPTKATVKKPMTAPTKTTVDPRSGLKAQPTNKQLTVNSDGAKRVIRTALMHGLNGGGLFTDEADVREAQRLIARLEARA